LDVTRLLTDLEAISEQLGFGQAYI